MKLTFDGLMELEKEQSKEKFYQNMGYVMYYLMIFFVYGFAFVVGGCREKVFLFGYFYFFAMAFNTKILPIFLVKEKGQQQNEFKKYTYVPISMKLLLRVKVALMAKQIAKASLIAQILALIGLGVDLAERRSAGESLFIPIQEIPFLMTPVLIGVVVFLIFVAYMYVCYREAIKE